MFEDYASAILRDYTRMRDGGLLLTNLMHPTPGKLKKECQIVFDRRYQKKDEIILNSFFEPREDKEAYRLAIKKHERDKFKSLDDILKKGARRTDEKNIELLAWLIDFQPRPYRQWSNNGQPIDKDPIAGYEGAMPKGLPEPHRAAQAKHRLTKKLKIVIVFLITVVFGTTFYFLRPEPTVKTSFPLINRHGKCMYWAGDHYATGSFALLHHDTPNVALDTDKIAYFRKISDWSTLSKNSVKKVWYAKINGQLEIYSTGGFHPVDTNRRLLPLTAYMLNKYVLNSR